MTDKRVLTPLERTIAERRGFKPRDFEKFPELTIRYENITHSTQGDFLGILEQVKRADIIAIENADYTPAQERQLNDFVQGKFTPIMRDLLFQELESKRDGYLLAFYKAIENTKKPVVSVDYTSSHKVLTEYYKKVQDHTREVYRGLSKADALKLFIEQGHIEMEFDEVREKCMLEALPAKLSKVFADNPLLLKRKALMVLMPYGAMHSPLYREIKRIHHRSSQHFPYSPFNFSHLEEFQRKIRHKQKYTTELLEKAFVSLLIGDMLTDVFVRQFQKQNTEDISRGIIDSLSADERDQIVTYTIQSPNPLQVVRIIGRHVNNVQATIDRMAGEQGENSD